MTPEQLQSIDQLIDAKIRHALARNDEDGGEFEALQEIEAQQAFGAAFGVVLLAEDKSEFVPPTTYTEIPERWFIYHLGEQRSPIRFAGDMHVPTGEPYMRWQCQVQHVLGGRLLTSNGATMQEAIHNAICIIGGSVYAND